MNRYFAFAVSMVLSALITSCSEGGFTLDDSKSSLEQTGDFARTSFDGCWDWYEKDEHTHKIIISNGEIASLTPTGRTTLSLSDADGNGSISPQDGLIALSYALPFEPGETQRITTFRFDLRNAGTTSMIDSLARGVIRGRKTVEDYDPEDIQLLPPTEEQDGFLVMCDAN